jgi:hypothetical protein
MLAYIRLRLFTDTELYNILCSGLLKGTACVNCRRLRGIFYVRLLFLDIMSTQEYIKKMMAVPIMAVVIVSVILMAENPIQPAVAVQETGGIKVRHVLIAAVISGNDMYMAWPDNNTGHWNVFFAKSTDGGKTFKTMMISPLNKGNTIYQNTEIYALGSNVNVSWWINNTGAALMKVFRESNDNGNTFGPITELNSTGYRYCSNLKQCRPA